MLAMYSSFLSIGLAYILLRILQVLTTLHGIIYILFSNYYFLVHINTSEFCVLTLSFVTMPK